MKRVISCVLLMLVLTSNAFALEVPTDTVVQNLNGSQQAIKTFTVSPEQDPAALIEEPFELEGYLYTFADIVKSENPVEEKRIHTEVITVETTKDDLALILEQLKPTIEYDDGRFQGTLALDHTSLNTVAAGYATKNYTVTETKTIGQLDRNDMSYVPATTIKNGRTLSLANVEWQVTGTDLVGEALMPSQYQAVATYSAKASYQAATGYPISKSIFSKYSRSLSTCVSASSMLWCRPITVHRESKLTKGAWRSCFARCAQAPIMSGCGVMWFLTETAG